MRVRVRISGHYEEGWLRTADGAEDCDGDGVGNADELELGTSAWLADSDGDGTADGAEDFDGDGLINDRPAGVARNSVRGDGQFNADLRLGWTKAFGPVREPNGPNGGGGGPRRGPGGGGPGGPGGGRGPGGGGGGMDGGSINPENRRYALESFAQATTVLNTVNYTGYSFIQSSVATFGQPILAAAPRRIELGMRIQF